MDTHWIYAPEMRLRIEELTHRWFFTPFTSPESFQLNRDIFDGGSAVGKRLMHPTGEPEHTQTDSVMDDDDETELYRWKWTVRGFWSVSFTHTLYLPVPMRGTVPVWELSVYGSMNQRNVGNKDLALQIHDDFLGRAAKARPHTNGRLSRFIPRGPEHFSHQEFRYEASWRGDHEWFHGSESVLRADEQIWSARFHGGLLLPIS